MVFYRPLRRGAYTDPPRRLNSRAEPTLDKRDIEPVLDINQESLPSNAFGAFYSLVPILWRLERLSLRR